MKLLLLVLSSLLFACIRHEETDPMADSRTEDLAALYLVRQERALTVRDAATGWLARNDCDAMIWSGKYAATGVPGVNIEAAEYPDAPGKFGRRPPPWCWVNDGAETHESASEWSRDMAAAGFLPWAWEQARLDVLQRHAAYGQAHSWVMGDPLASFRTYYTPQLRGVLYKTIAALGGEMSEEALWPAIWPAGLTDYEAHLQVMDIWLQGAVAQRLNDMNDVPKKPLGVVSLMEDGEWLTTPQGTRFLDISESMYERLVEHAAGEPASALYAYVLGKYTGDQSRTMSLLLDPAMPSGGYVRCADLEQCKLAEWLFVAHLLLADLPK